MNLVSDAPTFPAPKIPNARPWLRRENHAAFQEIPTLNRLPAKPTRKAKKSSSP